MKIPTVFEMETRNAILGALSAEEAERLRPHLSPREFSLGDEIARPNDVPCSACFLERGMLSSILHSKQNVDVETGVVGREGVWDAMLAFNAMPRTDHATVQAEGWGWSLPAPILRQEFGRGGTLARKILRYFDLAHTQAAATGVCNRLHTVEERLARWLLIVRGGAESDEFEMPSEFVASMLGSRLTGVPIALGVLQQAGLIMADRRFIRLLDVPALERTACECHAMLAERLQLYLDDPHDSPRHDDTATDLVSAASDGLHAVLRPGEAARIDQH